MNNMLAEMNDEIALINAEMIIDPIENDILQKTTDLDLYINRIISNAQILAIQVADLESIEYIHSGYEMNELSNQAKVKIKNQIDLLESSVDPLENICVLLRGYIKDVNDNITKLTFSQKAIDGNVKSLMNEYKNYLNDRLRHYENIYNKLDEWHSNLLEQIKSYD